MSLTFVVWRIPLRDEKICSTRHPLYHKFPRPQQNNKNLFKIPKNTASDLKSRLLAPASNSELNTKNLKLTSRASPPLLRIPATAAATNQTHTPVIVASLSVNVKENGSPLSVSMAKKSGWDILTMKLTPQKLMIELQ